MSLFSSGWVGAHRSVGDWESNWLKPTQELLQHSTAAMKSHGGEGDARNKEKDKIMFSHLSLPLLL